MKFVAFLFYLSALAALTPPAAAETPSKFTTGNVLYQDCTATAGEVAKLVGGAHCVSYIIGVADAHTAMTVISKTSPLFCIPGGATPGQLMDIVVGFLKSQPAKRHYMASTLVIMALSESLPCAAK